MAFVGPLAWRYELKTTIAAFSMETEYMSAYYLGQMLIYVRGLAEIGLTYTILYGCNNCCSSIEESNIPCKNKTYCCEI
jgi:hypothetical protein